MHKSTPDLAIEVVEIITSSFNRKFDVFKRHAISSAVGFEKSEARTIMRRALDQSRFRTPSNKQDRRAIEEELILKKPKLRQIKEQLKEVNHDLNSHFQSEMEKVRSDLTSTLFSALDDIDRKVLDHETRYDDIVGPLEMKRATIQRKIEHLRACLSPIRKLPTEIKTYIISLALEDVSKRDLALVCKEWEGIILNTPAFWRRIDTNDIISAKNTIFSRATPNKYLQCHLKLAKSLELDVTIDYRNGKHSIWLEPICHTLAAHGIKRWRSLVLCNGDYEGEVRFSIQGIFSGKFDSLRSLSIAVKYECEFASSGIQDFFSPLYPLIVETAPPLKSFTVIENEIYSYPFAWFMNGILNQLPAAFVGTRLLGELKTLMVPTHFLSQCKDISLETVEDLSLNYYTGNPCLNLPRIATLSCSLAVLAGCQKDSVQKLTIHVDDDIPETQISSMTFPVLQDLTFRGKNVIGGLIDLVAPDLRRLAFVGHEKERIAVKNSLYPTYLIRETATSNKLIKTTFQTHKNRLHVLPTDLSLYFHLHAKATMIVLECWPQLERLKLYWNREFRFRDMAKTLIGYRTKGPLVPNLLEMHIEMDCWDEDKVRDWKGFAREVMDARIRRGLPLEKITWTVYGVSNDKYHGDLKDRYTGGIRRGRRMEMAKVKVS